MKFLALFLLGGCPDPEGSDSAGDTTADTAEAAVPEGLEVVLTWDDASADLDLHLMDGVEEFFSVPTDCTWCNADPDWGVPGDTTDDPSRDIDDLHGFGPESTSVSAPASGSYTIGVHYFEENGAALVEATVETWAAGVLLSTDVFTLASNEQWVVGTVAFPGGTFAVRAAVATSSAVRGCAGSAR